MELISVTMPKNFKVLDMSDFHVGSPNCSLEKLQGVIDWVKREGDIFVINKGDAIECITPGDKRYTHSCVMDNYKTPKKQADKVIEMFYPIKDRILAWGAGNHELKLVNIMDFSEYMARELDTPYGAYVFKIAFRDSDGNLMFKTFHTHGSGTVNSNAKDDIQMAANKAASLKHKLSKTGFSDVIYMSMGHTHQLIVVEPTVQHKLFLTDDGTKIKQHYGEQAAQNAKYIPPDSRWYTNTGSFRGLYSRPGEGVSDYGEACGFAPAEMGCALITVEDSCIIQVEKMVA